MDAKVKVKYSSKKGIKEKITSKSMSGVNHESSQIYQNKCHNGKQYKKLDSPKVPQMYKHKLQSENCGPLLNSSNVHIMQRPLYPNNRIPNPVNGLPFEDSYNFEPYFENCRPKHDWQSSSDIHPTFNSSFSSYNENRKSSASDYGGIFPFMSCGFTPFAPTPSQIIEQKDKEIYALKGALKAYKYKFETEEHVCFSQKLRDRCTEFQNVIKARDIYGPFILDQSPLSRSLHLLLDNCSFHNIMDSQRQEGNDIMSLIKKGAKVPKERINSFMQCAYLTDFKEKVSLLEQSHQELKAVVLEIQKTKRTNFNGVKFKKCEVPLYTKISQDFFSWKDRFTHYVKKSEAAINKLASGFEKFALQFKSFSNGNQSYIPDLDMFECHHLLNTVDESEKDILNKVSVIPLSCYAALNELELRLSKLRKGMAFAEEIQEAFSNMEMNPNFSIRAEVEKDIPESSSLSLLDYISQSKSAVNRSAQKLFIEDIFKDLCEVHSNGETYLYLTPKNVLLSEGSATLCPREKVAIYEPIPPFTFFAPECEVEATVLDERLLISVGPSADWYSLGRLILWLACVDAKKDFVTRMTRLQEENELLAALLSTLPSRRPTVEKIHASLSHSLSKIFDLPFASHPPPIFLSSLSNQESKNSPNDNHLNHQIGRLNNEEEKILQMVLNEEQEIMLELRDEPNTPTSLDTTQSKINGDSSSVTSLNLDSLFNGNF